MAPRARKGRSGQAAPEQLDRSAVARAAGGDPAAQRQVFDLGRGIIARLARERADWGLSHRDLLQEGSLGLLAAMHEFAGGVDEDFETYAQTRVGEQMDNALQEEQSALLEEKQLVEDAAAFERAEQVLGRELQRPPTPVEIRERLGWEEGRLDEVASAVEDARRRHDQELLAYLDPEYFDPLDWIGENEKGGEGDADGGA